MSYTMQDFRRDYLKEKYEQLSAKERKQFLREILQTSSPEERLAGLAPQQIREYLDQMSAGRPSKLRKSRGRSSVMV